MAIILASPCALLFKRMSSKPAKRGTRKVALFNLAHEPDFSGLRLGIPKFVIAKGFSGHTFSMKPSNPMSDVTCFFESVPRTRSIDVPMNQRDKCPSILKRRHLSSANTCWLLP